MIGSRRGDGGFTLLETLVALAILGVVMSTVYAVIGSGLRIAHRDEDRLLLAMVAQNLLARSHYDLNPSAGALSGDIGGGLRWRIESEPYAVPQDILPEAPPAFEDAGTLDGGGETGAGGVGDRAGGTGGFADRTGGDGGGAGRGRRDAAGDGPAGDSRRRRAAAAAGAGQAAAGPGFGGEGRPALPAQQPGHGADG